MPFQKGRQKTGGRVAGRAAEKRAQALAAAMEASRISPEEASDLTPLAILLGIARRRYAAGDFAGAQAAASEAAPYCHPRLSQADIAVTSSVEHLSTDELERELAALDERAAVHDKIRARIASFPPGAIKNGQAPAQRPGLRSLDDDEFLQ